MHLSLTPEPGKKHLKVDEGPYSAPSGRGALKTFVAKSLRKKLGAQLLMRAACRTYMYTLPPPEKKLK